MIKKQENTIELSDNQLNKWVINLSRRELTKPQKQVLAKGLNFAVTPEKVEIW